MIVEVLFQPLDFYSPMDIADLSKGTQLTGLGQSDFLFQKIQNLKTGARSFW